MVTYCYQEHFVRTMLAARERWWGISNPYTGLPREAIMDSEYRDEMDGFSREHELDFCSRCHNHADYWRDPETGEWLSNCCDARPERVDPT